MPDKTWKRREREVATMLLGQRIPVTGERHGSDVQTSEFSVQVKHGRNQPGYLREWLDGIRAVTPMGKTGIVVWTTPHEPTRDAVVVMRFADLVQITYRLLNERHNVTPSILRED